MTFASGGSDLPACDPPASLSIHLASSAVHKYRSDNVLRMWVKLKTLCVCECYKGGIVVMDVIWRRLCVSMI